MKRTIYRIGLIGSLCIALAILLSLIVLPVKSQAAEKSPEAKGKEVFDSKCTLCHTIGGGKKIGPDLKGVTQRRTKEWLVKFISNPDEMLDGNDPIATGLLKEYNDVRMPSQGLTKDQVTDVITYLKSQEEPVQPKKEKPKTK